MNLSLDLKAVELLDYCIQYCGSDSDLIVISDNARGVVLRKGMSGSWTPIAARLCPRISVNNLYVCSAPIVVCNRYVHT